MVSGLAWLDSSREDQQRMRELLNMFSEQESRVELGIGQVRDAFSDLLFPGTSVLHTRSRYLLIVPWCHLEAEGRGLRGEALAARVAANERKVIVALKAAGESDGLIGRVAGVAVKVLPSAIYGTALARFGIRTSDDDSAGSARLFSDAMHDAPEMTLRTANGWHPTLPAAPDGFPATVDGGFALTSAEASWLRERILAAAPDSLLAYLVTADDDPDLDSPSPWTDPVAVNAPEAAAVVLRHARLFSRCMHGAALVYNLLIAERYEKSGLTEHEEPVARYRRRLSSWAAEISTEPDLGSWRRDDLWNLVTDGNPRIATNLSMKRFVDGWLDAVQAGTASAAAENDGLRSLIGERERLVKKSQSRLMNERLLRTWNGASGSAPLVYRWPQVRREVVDVRVGLEDADAAA